MSQYSDNNYGREPARRSQRYPQDGERRSGSDGYDSAGYDDYAPRDDYRRADRGAREDHEQRGDYRSADYDRREDASRRAGHESRRSYADSDRRNDSPRRTGRPARPAQRSGSRARRRSGGASIVLPRGFGLAAGAMAVLLCLAIVFQQLGIGAGETVAASSNITGNVIEGSPIRITEVMTSNSSALADEDGEYVDWIEIKNITDQPVSLAGYLLSDSVTKDKFYPLPAVTVPAGSYMVIYASGKSRGGEGQNIHTSFKLSSSGETLYLLDDMSNILDIVEIPALGSNYSYARDLSANTWSVTDKYTPGYPNEEQYFEQILASRVAADSALIINEICASNKTIITDEDGEYVDWIELYNSGAEPINLKGYGLSDKSGKPMLWTFPDVTIEPGAYLIVYASSKSRTGAQLHTNFSLGSEKSEVLLSNAQGQILDLVYYDLIPQDSTYGRDETGGWRVFAQGTPGYANTQQSMAVFEQSLSARNTTGLFLEEALASNTNATSANPESYDWLELYNSTDATISLEGYGLSNDPSNPRKWQFPAGATIEPGYRLIVYCSGQDTYDLDERDYHTNFNLSSAGATLTLCTPDGTIIDKLPMDAQYADVSFGRVDGQDGFFYLTTPTPAQPNASEVSYGKVSEVSFSVEGGLKTDAVTLELSCSDPNAQIYYTLDCTDPTSASTPYAGPIEISSSAVVRAVAVRDGYMDSFIHSATYLYGVSHTMPVISIVTDPDNLFDYYTGIMEMGPNAEEEFPYGSRNTGANFWMDWEYMAGFEYFDVDGQQVTQQNIGIALVGQYSRAEDQKSIGLYARSRYGKETFEFNPFSDLDFTEYHALVLRASGQDGPYTRMRDAVLTSLAEGTGVYYQESTPVIVYLNGEYWGHYNLRERVNKWSIAQHEGVTDEDQIENIDLIKGNTRVINGSYDSFEEILEFVKTHSLTDEENLQWVADRVDIENYLTYVAMEMLVANTDTGNIKFYRVPGGKWKWVFFDLDWAAFDMRYDYVQRYLNDEGHGVSRAFNNRLIMGLLENDGVRDQFLKILADLMKGNFSNENIRAKVEEYKALLEPEMAGQFDKWGSSFERWEKYINTFISNITGHKKTFLEDLQAYFGLSGEQMAEYFGEVDMS